MLFTAKDDRSSLDNASVRQVQNLFSTWIRSDKAHAERIAAGYGYLSHARYQHCVHVDASALDVCLEWFACTREHNDIWPHLDSKKTPYVNVVRAEEILYHAPDLTELVREIYPVDEEVEEDEQDKGPIFVKMELPYVMPGVYTKICRLIWDTRCL
jgi:hypothetical protein